MKRPEKFAASASDQKPGALCKLSVRLSSLWEWLCDPRWDDGSERQTGTLMIMVEDGVVKAWLHDREMAASAWVSSESLEGVLGLADKGLKEERLEWRPDKRKEGKKK